MHGVNEYNRHLAAPTASGCIGTPDRPLERVQIGTLRLVLVTPLVREVLRLFLGDPQERRTGYQVMAETGKPGGTVYPLLRRLEDEGLLEGEDEPSPYPRRPPRRSFKLTTAGVERARTIVD